MYHFHRQVEIEFAQKKKNLENPDKKNFKNSKLRLCCWVRKIDRNQNGYLYAAVVARKAMALLRLLAGVSPFFWK